jgi:hypothetical protein
MGMQMFRIDVRNGVCLLAGYAIPTAFLFRTLPWDQMLSLLGIVLLTIASAYGIVSIVGRIIWYRRYPGELQIGPSPNHPQSRELFPVAWGYTLLLLMVPYLLLLLIPSYWSSIYRFSEDEIGVSFVDVPIYSHLPQYSPVVLVALLVFMATSVVVIPFSIAIVMRLVISWHTASRFERIFWMPVGIITIIGMSITIPIVNALVGWLID